MGKVKGFGFEVLSFEFGVGEEYAYVGIGMNKVAVKS